MSRRSRYKNIRAAGEDFACRRGRRGGKNWACLRANRENWNATRGNRSLAAARNEFFYGVFVSPVDTFVQNQTRENVLLRRRYTGAKRKSRHARFFIFFLLLYRKNDTRDDANIVKILRRGFGHGVPRIFWAFLCFQYRSRRIVHPIYWLLFYIKISYDHGSGD